MVNDDSVIKDVLNYCFLDNRIDHVKVEHCAKLLGHVTQMITHKYEAYITTGIKSAQYLLKHFSQLIMDTLTAPVGTGLDLAREERINKCEGCFNGFKQILESDKLMNHAKRQNTVGELASELAKDLEVLVWSCKR